MFAIDRLNLRFKLKRVPPFVPCPSFEQVGVTTPVVEFKEWRTEKMRLGSWQYVSTMRLDGCESPATFGCGLFSHHGIDHYRCFIDYNPNKTVIPSVMVDYLMLGCAKIEEIVDLDLCYDLKDLMTDSIMFDANGSSQVMEFGTLSAPKTRYLHPKSNHGRVKVYDKEKERQGKPDADQYEGITRVEFSFHNVGWLLFDKWYQYEFDKIHEILRLIQQVKIPSVWYQPDVYASYNKSNIFAIDSLIECGRSDLAQDFINCLGKNQQSKYRDYMRKRCFVPLQDDSISFGFELHDKLMQLIPCDYLAY